MYDDKMISTNTYDLTDSSVMFEVMMYSEITAVGLASEPVKAQVDFSHSNTFTVSIKDQTFNFTPSTYVDEDHRLIKFSLSGSVLTVSHRGLSESTWDSSASVNLTTTEVLYFKSCRIWAGIGNGNSMAVGSINPSLNASPTTILNSPIDNTALTTENPTLSFTATDPEGESVNYQVQVSAQSNFSTLHTDYTSPTYPSGAQQSYTLTSALSRGGVTYYWRARAIDSSGSGNYGSWSATRTMITATTAPTIATGVATGSATDSITVSNSRASSNPDDQQLTEFGVVYSTSANPTLSNSKKVGTGNASGWDTTLTGLSENTTYYIRAYAINSTLPASISGSPFYGPQITYKTQGRPVTTLNAPVNNANVETVRPVVSFTGTDVDGNKISYQVQINNSSTMTAPLVDAVSASDAGFTSTTTDPFNSGATVNYTLQQDLARSTTYYWRVRGRDTNGSNTWGLWSNLQSFSVDAAPPTVTTGSVSGVSYTFATVAGEVVSAQGASVTERGVVYSTSQNPTIANSKVVVGNGTGSFSTNLSGLADNTTYYVRAYATNTRGTSYGAQVSFTTNEITAPSLVTIPESSISYTSFSTGGDISSANGASVTERGVVYAKTQNPTTANSKFVSGSGTGPFIVNLTGLDDGATYYVRAYATNARGTAYGNQITATTIATAAPVVTSSTATNILTTSAKVYGTVTGDNGSGITERGFVYATTANPTTANTKRVVSGAVGSYDYTLTGLSDGTQYNWRAYAINAKGVSYSENRVFTTLKITVPTVSTTAISNVTTSSANSGGNVTAANNGTITERGIVYSTSANPTVLDTKITTGGTTGSFISSMTGLSSNTTYYVRAYAINEKGPGYGTQQTFTTDPTPPTVTTGAVAGNTTNSMTVNGSKVATNPDSLTIEEFGVVYSTSPNPTVANSKSVGTGSASSWNASLTGLSQDTTYYVRGYAKWRGTSYSYGSQTTHKTQGIPTVTPHIPLNAEEITSLAPSLEFTGIDADGNNISYQIQVSTDAQYSQPIIDAVSSSDNRFSTVSGGGVDPYNSGTRIKYMPDGLWRGQNFHWRVRGRDVAGANVWGSWSTSRSFFIAPILAGVTVNSVNDVTFETADVVGEVISHGGASVTERGAVFSTTPNPTVSNNKVSAGTGNGVFTANLTGLVGSTRYYVRAYAINSVGTSYSSQIEFRTSQIPAPPTIVTGHATSITESTVEIRDSEVVLDGTSTVFERGVVYDLTTGPTIDDGKIIASSLGVGLYNVGITGLNANTTYHARAYAINSLGISYGEEITFTTDIPFVPDEGDGYWTWAPDRSNVVVGRSQATPSHTSADLYLADLQLEHDEDYTVYFGDVTAGQGSPSVVLQWLDSGVEKQTVLAAGVPHTFNYDASMTNWVLRLFVTGATAEPDPINALFSDLYLAQESEFSGFVPFIPNGTTEIKLENNWILDKRREETIQNIFNIVEGEGWYAFKATTTGLGWYEIGDRVTVTDEEGTRDVVIWDTSLTIDGGIKDSISATTPNKTETDYKKAGNISDALKRTQISVDHNEQEILSLAEEIYNVDGVINTKFTSIEQSIDSISSTVQSSGGVNLLKNSVMYNHEDPSKVSRDNIALGKNVTGSSAVTVGTLDMITNGDTASTNYVSLSAGEQYVEIDLGDVYEINEVRVWHYYQDSRSYHNTATAVSEDGTTWTTVASPASYVENSGGNTRTFAPIKARYVRDYINGNTINIGSHWVEIQVFAVPQYIPSWHLEGQGSLVVQASPESISAGGISGNAFTLSDMKATQRVTVRKDADFISEDEKQLYAFSAKVKKNIVGSAYIRLTNRNETHEIELPDQIEYYWEEVKIEELLPIDDHYVVEIWSDDDADLQVTDVMLSPGSNIRQWTQANGEVMNTSVVIDDDAVTVRSNVYRNDFTRITALGFEVHKHDASGDRIFGFNGDETNVYKLKADQQISMGPIRAVPLEYGNYKGWALTRTEE